MIKEPCLYYKELVEYVNDGINIEQFFSQLNKNFDNLSDKEKDEIIKIAVDIGRMAINKFSYPSRNDNRANARVGHLIRLYYKKNKFSKQLAHQFVLADDIMELYRWGVEEECPDEVFVPEIGYYLYNSNNQEFIKLAMEYWSKDRLQYLCKSKIIVSY